MDSTLAVIFALIGIVGALSVPGYIIVSNRWRLDSIEKKVDILDERDEKIEKRVKRVEATITKTLGEHDSDGEFEPGHLPKSLGRFETAIATLSRLIADPKNDLKQ